MTMSHPNAACTSIAGVTPEACHRLLTLVSSQPHLQEVCLFGSRAMARYQLGSDIDLCLEGPQLTYRERLQLMEAVDDLLLPWQVDLVLRHELPSNLESHIQRVGRCIWRQP
jgi:predicted nucleotidyltransferase